MSKLIITALRQQTQLTGNAFIIAVELAHRMNNSGYVRMAYEYIALKAHCCERTAQRQVARLVGDYRVFRKYVFRTPHGTAINLYKYLGSIPHCASPPVTTQGDSLSVILPEPEREKENSLRTDIETQKKGMRYWTEGSDQWEASMEKVRTLEALLQQTPVNTRPGS